MLGQLTSEEIRTDYCLTSFRAQFRRDYGIKMADLIILLHTRNGIMLYFQYCA